MNDQESSAVSENLFQELRDRLSADNLKRSGCTQALVTGLTSLQGNMTGQCVDGPAGAWPGFIKLVVPERGNRYLTVGGLAEEIFPLLNEKGIACSQGHA